MARLKGRRSQTLRAAFRAALFCLLPAALCLPCQASDWERQPSGTLAWLRAVYFVDESRGWAVGGKGTLLTTRDGGASWRQLPAPTADTLRDVFFTDARTGWLVCEADVFKLKSESDARSYLLRTADGGATWSRVEVPKREAGKDARTDEAPGRLLRVAFADPAHGWTFGEEGTVYATSDGGDTWARQSVPTRHLLLGAAFLDARRGWLVGAGATFLHTTDGGATWSAGSLAPTARPDAAKAGASDDDASQRMPHRVNAVAFADDRRGWAVGSTGSIYATTDGGRFWRALPSVTDADLLDVKFSDAREGWAVGASGTLLHTTDGGATWSPERADSRHQLERLFVLNRTAAWAVGFGGTIISSSQSNSADQRRRRGSQ